MECTSDSLVSEIVGESFYVAKKEARLNCIAMPNSDLDADAVVVGRQIARP